MTFTRLRAWLQRKWSHALDPSLAESYRIVFGGLHGERVLQHLLDQVYCTVYEGHDPVELAKHAGRRSVVHELLENLDMAEQPDKYRVSERKEPAHG